MSFNKKELQDEEDIEMIDTYEDPTKYSSSDRISTDLQ